MMIRHALRVLPVVLLASGGVACSSNSDSATETAASPSGSEVAVSVVSGALNNNSGTSVSLLGPHTPKRTLLERGLAALNPIGTAEAAEWSCSGDTLSPKYAGPGSYR